MSGMTPEYEEKMRSEFKALADRMFPASKGADPLTLTLAPKAKHFHCVHAYSGVLHMVVPSGHVVVQCCECGGIYTHHAGHKWEGTSEPCSRRKAIAP